MSSNKGGQVIAGNTRQGRSKYRDAVNTFVRSGFECAEVVPEEGDDARKAYMGFTKFAKKAGVKVVRRGDRIFLARGDAQ